MKKYNYDRLLLVLCVALAVIAVFLCSSCDSFLEVDAPNSQLNSGNVFEEKATANAAMTDIYARMRDAGMLTGNSSGLSHLLGVYTDELDYYGTTADDAQSFYNNNLTAPNVAVKDLWNSAYNQIYSSNLVIAGVDNSIGLAQADKDQLKGEALFVRALLHFYLANLYGPVPYVTGPDYSENSHVTRIPVADVYGRCIDDLETAISLLPEDYVSPERTRPNLYAAHALLARVALYAGQYDMASNEASAVLNNTALYAYESNLDNIFLKESTSTIWQFSPDFEGTNSLEATTFIFEYGPPPISALSQDLLDAFTPGDLRRDHWVNAVSDGETTWYHPYKYKVVYGAPATEYSIVLRLGELYLIRAEARARAGELIGAKEDLNVIRQTAGIGDTPAVTQEEILADILQQRRLELFTEFGHRFFDLKRFGVINTVLPMTKSGWDANDALLPIPETELQLNPALAPQNAGY